MMFRWIICITFVMHLCMPQSTYAQQWVDSTFEDFSRGTLDASGQNIYVSKKGEIRTIRRYDLNNDGHIDLLFNSTHDFATDVQPTLASWSQQRALTTWEMDVPGSLFADAADLNNDGYIDIVFCPNHSGLQHPRKFVSIAWGGSDGWPNSRLHGMLPVYDPLNILIADLNKDGWPDIVTLNKTGWSFAQPEGNIVRVYWGSEQGFRLDHYRDWGIPNATAMAAGDFDGDGIKEIVVANLNGQLFFLDSGNNASLTPSHEMSSPIISMEAADTNNDGYDDLILSLDGESVAIAYFSKDQISEQVQLLDGVQATRIAFGDLDGDGFQEMILTNFSIHKAGGGEMAGGDKKDNSGVRILWGSNKGFDLDNDYFIRQPYAISAAVGDFDGDGNRDLVIGIFQEEGSYDTPSKIYFGNGSRQLTDAPSLIDTKGAHYVMALSGNDGEFALFCNSITGTPNERVPLLLYWGSEQGFSVENLTKIPFTSGYEASAADLNEDGYVDLIAINSMHGGNLADPMGGANIFMGKPSGFEFEKLEERILLSEIGATTSNVADLDKDGYLDLVLGFFDRPDKKPTELVIYYGDENGYSIERRVAIPSKGRSSSPMIADFDNDGWLDIAVASYTHDLLRVFWGSPNGFSEENSENIPTIGIIDLEVADLNDDGYLDIIVCHYKDKVNNHHDTGISILWGSENGFDTWNSQWLPSYTALGPVIADFDNDGYLDIFCPSYHGDVIRGNIAMYLYWGSEEGYNKKNKTVFFGDSGADALAADFNRDGLIDLAVAHHTTQADHGSVLSKVYYNDGQRFTSPHMEVTSLPSVGTHWMWNKDMGHIYDRSWQQSYTSRIFDWRQPKTKIILTADAETPLGTNLRAYVRSASTEDALENAPWRPLISEASISEKDRFLQYKYDFISDNGDRFPVLKGVFIGLK